MPDLEIQFVTLAELSGAQALAAEFERGIGRLKAMQTAGLASAQQIEELGKKSTALAKLNAEIDRSAQSLKRTAAAAAGTPALAGPRSAMDEGEARRRLVLQESLGLHAAGYVNLATATEKVIGPTDKLSKAKGALHARLKVLKHELQGVPGLWHILTLVKRPAVAGVLAIGAAFSYLYGAVAAANKKLAEAGHQLLKPIKLSFPEIERADEWQAFMASLAKSSEATATITERYAALNAEIEKLAQLTGQVAGAELGEKLAGVATEEARFKATGGKEGLSPERAAERRAELRREAAAAEENRQQTLEVERLENLRRAAAETEEARVRAAESVNAASERERRARKAAELTGERAKGTAETVEERLPKFEGQPALDLFNSVAASRLSKIKFQAELIKKGMVLAPAKQLRGFAVAEIPYLREKIEAGEAADTDKLWLSQLETFVAEYDLAVERISRDAKELAERNLALKNAGTALKEAQDKLKAITLQLATAQATLETARANVVAEREARAAVQSHEEGQRGFELEASRLDAAGEARKLLEREVEKLRRDLERRNEAAPPSLQLPSPPSLPAQPTSAAPAPPSLVPLTSAVQRAGSDALLSVRENTVVITSALNTLALEMRRQSAAVAQITDTLSARKTELG